MTRRSPQRGLLRPAAQRGLLRPAPQRGLLRSARLRLTVLAAAVTGVALAVGAFLLVSAVERRLVDGVRSDVLHVAGSTADAIAAGQAPGDAAQYSLGAVATVQVLTDDGRLIASSGADMRFPMLAAQAQAAGQPVSVEELTRRFEVATQTLQGPTGMLTVVAASPLDDVRRSVTALSDALWYAIPVVVLLAALVTWWLAGRALRPVGRMREQQQRFVSDASHELRSPIATIRTTVEVGARAPAEADWAGISGVVLAESERLDGLVTDLLELARLDEGAAPATPSTEVDLDELVLADAARLRATGRQVRTEHVSAGRVRGCPRQLERMVRNLMDNAARHAKGVVDVSLGVESHDVVLRVDDDGPGVRAADRAKVFERFTRLDEGRHREAGGAGLGLALVRAVAHAHGGSVTVGDAPAGGARFEARLPAG